MIEIENLSKDYGPKRATRQLHADPPLTPAGLLLRHGAVVPVIAGLFVLLALGAAIDHGSLLLAWDQPVTRGVDAIRTSLLGEVMVTVTRLGGTATAASGFVLLLLLGLAWRRCQALAVVLIVSTLARPVLEWALKALIDRPRPQLAGTAFAGPSFPSGHVMAAVALWGLVPPVVALFTQRRWVWWASVAASGMVIGLVAALLHGIPYHGSSEAVHAYTRGHSRTRLSCKSGISDVSAVPARARACSRCCTRLVPAVCCLFSKHTTAYWMRLIITAGAEGRLRPTSSPRTPV